MATSSKAQLALLAQRVRAFEFLYDAVVVTDREGKVVDWNPGAAALYGYRSEEIVGQPVSVLHAPEDVDRVTEEVFAAIARDGFWTGEIKRREKNGNVGWIESMVIPLLDQTGATTGALGINRDITRRKDIEGALRSSETHWKTLLETLPDAVVISDHEGQIVIVNARAEDLLGYPREELLGQSIDILLAESQRGAHVAHRAGFLGGMRSRLMGSGRIFRARRKDGRTVPVEIGLSVIETPEGPWVVAIVHDVSAREAMIEQLALLGTALGAAANGIAISDARGVCEWINPGFTAITGYRPEDIVGKPLSLLRSGAHDKDFFRELWTTITAGRSWHGEITNRHRDGHLYVEEQTIAPVRNASGEVHHFIAIKQDITMRREMEDQLRTANETLTRHVAEIEALHTQLREQAIRDPLTGLYNRRYLAETLDRE
ncbi:MAG: PAS domain S-box protein, partial [Deltaproteobacteria bacterium]